MWRSSASSGIAIFRNAVFAGQLSSRTEAAIPDSVNALLEISDDEIWAAGTGGIAIRKNAKWRRAAEADGIPGQTIYSLALAKGGAVWAGGSAGVGLFYRNSRNRVVNVTDGMSNTIFVGERSSNHAPT